jgi:hypothetical protein
VDRLVFRRDVLAGKPDQAVWQPLDAHQERSSCALPIGNAWSKSKRPVQF